MIQSLFAAGPARVRQVGHKPALAARRFSFQRSFFSTSPALAGLVFTISAGAQPALESVQVPTDGGAVTFTNHFDRGDVFLFKAAGAVTWGQKVLDAEYESDGVSAPGADVVAGKDVGIDTGLKAPRTPKGVVPGRLKWFGGYRADHVYYVLATGTGEPLTLRLVTGGTLAGTGAITVTLFRLSPAPAALPPPLETLPVSVLAETLPTTLSVGNGMVYLLQASGTGRVGGGGLGRGDADYMDFKADGSGAEDVGDNNVDYGLGVDETDTGKSPRQNWWGPFRLDHIYYQLYAGTGGPIHFHYYDSGYGDNSPTDRLTVKVFSVP